MKRKLIILVLTAFCFTALVRVSLVHAQTPTPATQTGADADVVLKVLKILFSIQGSAADQKAVDDYKNSLTPSAQSTVAPGSSVTPGPSPTPDASSKCNSAAKGYYACKLVEEVRRACGGRVQSGNASCLNGISMPGRDASVINTAIGEMKSSATQTGELQCVGFVKAALYIIRNGDSEMLQNRGNAIDWIGNNPKSFAIIRNDGNQKLQDGDVPIWGYDTYGHIAIYIGGGQIAEGNFDGHGQVNIRAVNESSPSLVGWLRPL